MKAVILAGGRGTRLRPLTDRWPKPMLPIGNQPVLAYLLNLLKYHHFTEVIITVQYMADSIQAYFGDGSYLGMTIHYALEQTPLGTAGGVKNAEPYLGDETFLVISGDILTNVDLSSVARFHQEKEALVTLVLKQVADPRGYGQVVIDRGGRILHYLEKPNVGQIVAYTVNTGIYILEPEVLAAMQPNVAYDFSYDIFPYLVGQEAPVFGYLTNGYWCDMGTRRHYWQAAADVLGGGVTPYDSPR